MKKKTFDCVEMKHKAAAEIYKRVIGVFDKVMAVSSRAKRGDPVKSIGCSGLLRRKGSSQ